MSFLGYTIDDYSPRKNTSVLQYIKHDNTYFKGAVKMICPCLNSTKFHAILGIDNNKHIIPNSNSFLVDSNFINNHDGLVGYDDIHTIFSRLNIAFKHLLETPVDIIIENEMFLLANPFTGTNIGHDLSIIFNRIHIYKEHKLNIPVVLPEFIKTIPRSLEMCRMLLPETDIFFIPDNKVIQFTNLHITENIIFDIMRHKYLADEIIKTVMNTNEITSQIDKYKDKKIILIKTNNHKYVVNKWTAFHCPITIELLTTKYGWIFINPEEITMTEMIAYLYLAKRIVTSFGAISYAHTMFFNPKINYHYLQSSHGPYFMKEKHVILHKHLDLDANPQVVIDFLEK